MDAEVEVDGQSTGVRMKIDWGQIFQSIFQWAVIAAIGGGWAYFSSINSNVRDSREDMKSEIVKFRDEMKNEIVDLKSQITIANYKLETMEKSQAGYVTKAEIESSRRLRDAQIVNLQDRLEKIEDRLESSNR